MADPVHRPAQSRCEFSGERSHLPATAALFGVSVASVVKWSHRWRAGGSAAARPMGGRRPLRLTGSARGCWRGLPKSRTWTLRAVEAELAERDTAASYGAVWRFFKHEGITLKKTLHASEQDRADIARRRIRWKTHQSRFDPRRLVFIDETPAFAGAGFGPRPI